MAASGRDTPLPTRDRLVHCGLELFAANGFEGTTVGDIEAAAGLQPRRGAMYRYFPSKESLLEAAIAEYTVSLDRATIDFAPDTSVDPRTLATAFARWLLDRVDAERALTHVFERDGERVPDIRRAFRKNSDAGMRAASRTIRSFLALTDRGGDADPDALAVLLLGGLINLRRSTWTLGGAPLRVSDRRAIAGFAEMFTRLISP